MPYVPKRLSAPCTERFGSVEVALVVAVKCEATTWPTTDSFAYGEVVPMPTLPANVLAPVPCTMRFPVVVAPPEMVSPPACAPEPMVEEAVMMMDWIVEVGARYAVAPEPKISHD